MVPLLLLLLLVLLNNPNWKLCLCAKDSGLYIERENVVLKGRPHNSKNSKQILRERFGRRGKAWRI